MRCFCGCLLLLLCSASGHAQNNSYLSHAYVASGNGQSARVRKQASDKTHTATLTWKPSSSHVAGYNVYRSEVSGQKYQKINSSLVKGLTYKDNTVLKGVTYYYVTRAVDDQGRESENSNETIVSVP
jgi:fibronectin type 3 domain-containing protein